eukprot:COSAG02_NODE_6021_length_3870_cov_4.904535_5_plen_535_part_00
MPAISASSTIDTAISKLKVAADSCGYGLTDRRLKPLRIAMEQYPLCLSAFPDIMEMQNKVLGNDSKQKYMRVVMQLCESVSDDAQPSNILCAEVVRKACETRSGSLDSTAKIASSVIHILANALRGDECELTEDETRRTNALISLQRDALAKKQEDKQRAPLLTTWRNRLVQAKLHADCDKSIVDLLENDEHDELKYLDYGGLTTWVGILLRTYLVPARSNMFNKVIWGTDKGENAEGCIHLRDDETILIQLGRPSGGNTKNGNEVTIDTRDVRFKNLEDLGMTDCKLVYKALKCLQTRCELLEGDAYIFSNDAECMSPCNSKVLGGFFTHVTGGDPALYRRSFEQAAQDYLRDDSIAFTDDNDALVHELCQHSAVASKENYCAMGDDTQLPDSLWLEEYGTTEDSEQEDSDEENNETPEDPGNPENNEENNEENSPDDRRSPSPTPVQSPRARRRPRSPTPDRAVHPDYTRVLGTVMDAILDGDATEQDYARAASAAFLIPMLGQQDRLHGADLSFVQTAIDASRAAKRARTE